MVEHGGEVFLGQSLVVGRWSLVVGRWSLVVGPFEVECTGRMPCGHSGAVESVGVLRLRDCFASRNNHFVQDDKFYLEMTL